MGGMIAQELVLKCPGIFASCTLLSTHSGSTLPPLNDNFVPVSLVTVPMIMLHKEPMRKVELILPLLFPQHHLKAKGPEGYETMYDYHKEVLLERMSRTRPQTLPGALGQIAAAMTHKVSDERLELLAKVCIELPKSMQNIHLVDA